MDYTYHVDDYHSGSWELKSTLLDPSLSGVLRSGVLESAERLQRRLPPGFEFDVWYNPRDVNESFAERSFGRGPLLALIGFGSLITSAYLADLRLALIAAAGFVPILVSAVATAFVLLGRDAVPMKRRPLRQGRIDDRG